jgi:DNA polymerase-3 subunit epsilon
MWSQTPDAIRASLTRLRRDGEPVALGELAHRLLALRPPVDPSVARRLVATVLGRSAASLPGRIPAPHLRPPEEAAVADADLARAEFVVVDLETTGLAPATCAILEIGAVRVVGLRPAGRFHTLIRQPEPLARAIADLTGIDDAMLADAPEPLPALRGFRSWLSRTAPAPFVAHNARFDAGFVAASLARLGLPPLCVPVLCTRKLARRIAPEVERTNLDALCAHFGIANPARHRALGDARATATLLIELLGLARRRHGIASVGELLDLQDAPLPRRRRRRR